MDKEKVISIIQGKINCMKKCDVFQREESEYFGYCDECEYCYTQGNFGEQLKAFKTAVKLLKEME